MLFTTKKHAVTSS